ncbi:MAG: TVP38/TMEM64 family protein [Clostridiales bacterium]|nr:TVP38/TMEM64 family protein [Clostridiales bacterium]
MKKISIINVVLNLFLIVLIGIMAIVFLCLYLDTFNEGFLFLNVNFLTQIGVSIVIIFTIFALIFQTNKNKIIFKIFYLLIFFISLFFCVLYFLKTSGFLDKIDTVEDFRKLISSFNKKAVFLFILLQFLGVLVLPVPGVVSIGAGILSFGLFKGAFYSLIGILLGSLTAFFIGKKFGYKFVSFLVGKDNLDKGMKMINGKDKLLLTIMFLFPFFPDDLLCFIAGLSSIDYKYFLIMIFITRTISIFTVSLSLNNSIIPYTTWWGILIWGLLILGIILLVCLIYKKGDELQKYLLKLKNRRNKDGYTCKKK